MYKSVDILLEDETVLHAACAAEIAIHKGDWCVAENNRIPEFGRVTALADQEGASAAKGTAAVVRRATLQDQSRAKENAVLGRMAMKTAVKRVEERKLPVRVAQVRYTFDRAVLHVAYAAEDRVDCGDLGRTLAAELHTRVELRQIGVRDAARLSGGMGTCGRKLCCREWLRRFDAVSVKMAKTQGMALNPGTIGGMCGRLKCCLRYEFPTYKELSATLPKNGAAVRCPDGCGVLADRDVLRQRLRVRLEDGRMLDFPAADVSALGQDSETSQQKEEGDA